ncbi:bifunctional ornithine acetyltransferase/N-acetylglutamate synthase, partial [Novacetimonas hansenii]
AGNANVFTGRAGFEATQANAADAARLVNCAASEVFLASTGVIGEILPYQKISAALPGLHATLSENGWADAARGIMTTDTFPKAATRTARIGSTTVRIQGIAKGSGMVAPDMATMLSFVATDAKLPAGVIQSLLTDGVN